MREIAHHYLMVSSFLKVSYRIFVTSQILKEDLKISSSEIFLNILVKLED